MTTDEVSDQAPPNRPLARALLLVAAAAVGAAAAIPLRSDSVPESPATAAQLSLARTGNPATAQRGPAATASESQLLVDAGSRLASRRAAAIDELARRGPVSIETACRALAGSGAARDGARCFLAQNADATAAPALVSAIRNAGPQVPDTLIHGLARAGGQSAADMLLELVEGPTSRPAIVAGSALGRNRMPVAMDRLRRAAGPESPAHNRQAALLAFAGRAETQDLALLQAASCETSAPLRAAAVESLFRSSAVARSDAHRLLIDDNSQSVRIAAAIASRHLRAEWAATELALCLDDSSSDVRRTAVRSFGKRGGPASFEHLAAVVLNDTEASDVRGIAAQQLVAIDEHQGVAFLAAESAVFDLSTRLYTDPLLEQASR